MSSGHVETSYGDGILNQEVGGLGDYIAVVDPIAWQLGGESVSVPPRRVLVPRSLERSELDGLAASVPPGTPLAGVGGGMVMDATKYLALSAGTRPVLAPSITSSNAPFSDFISVRTGGEPTGMKAPGQPKRVVVDFELIGREDPRLNRAGFADLLAHEVALWHRRRAAGQGGLAWDEEACSAVARVMGECRAAAADIGSSGRRGIEFVMRTFERMTRLLDEPGATPIGSGSEHLVAWNVEAVTGRHFIHGEVVALGIVVAGVVHGDVSLQGTLDQAKVRYRLGDLGLRWAELEEALRTVDEYNRRVRGFDTVFTDLDWTDELLATVRAAVAG